MATKTQRPAAPAGRSMDARWLSFAGVYLMLAGLLNLIWGITALANDDNFVEDGLIFSKLNTWGWIAILIATLQFGTGAAVYARRMGGMLLALLVAMCAIVFNFLSVGAYPIWSIVAMVCNALVLWAVTVHSDGFQ